MNERSPVWKEIGIIPLGDFQSIGPNLRKRGPGNLWKKLRRKDIIG
jgi:hypothetical protein